MYKLFHHLREYCEVVKFKQAERSGTKVNVFGL